MIFFLQAALAQAVDGSGFDAHGFWLAAHDADPRDPLVGWRPGWMGNHSWFASAVLEYANQPLVFEQDGENVVQVDDLVALNNSIGYAPHGRVRIDLTMPVYLYSSGVDGPIGASLGDLRATGLVALVVPDGDGVGLGLVGNVDVPTGSPTLYRGLVTVAGGVGVAATGQYDRLTLSASASTQLRPNTQPEDRPAPSKGGDAFTWAASVGVLITEETGLTLEGHGLVYADSAVRGALGTPVETLLSMKHVRENGGFLTAGLGVGLTRGAGASPLRLLVGGGFGRLRAPLKDLDEDGIADVDDLCPEAPETLNGHEDEDGCPDVPPKIEFRVINPGGELAEEATLKISGAEEREGTGTLVFENATPGSQWHVEAALGECLVGSADVTMGPEGDVIDVVLERRRTGKVFVEAVDPDGKAVPAEISFRTRETPCAPSTPTQLVEGAAEVPVGPGDFFAFINAPGFDMHQERFEMDDGGSTTLRVVLTPSLATMVEKEDGTRVIEIREKVFFDTGKAEILEQSFPLLDTVARIILDEAVEHVEVGGHTDDRGRASTNQKLSQRRADAVKAYLVSKEVPDEVLTAVGYGEEKPVADNKTPEGKDANRRVEFVVSSAP